MASKPHGSFAFPSEYTGDRKAFLALLKEKSYEKRRVVLSSGRESNFYIDCKQTTLDARGAVLWGPIGVAFDDTKVAKNGKKIAGASWHRDPMSPPFHVNFLYGLRFIQASILFPCYRSVGSSARALPVRFENAPVLKKPGKRATEEQKQAYRQLHKHHNLSTQTLRVIESLRRQLDTHGVAERVLLTVVDGSFCNRTVLRAPLDRVDLVARCRKDARLCMPAPKGGRRKYAPETFTPEQVCEATR